MPNVLQVGFHNRQGLAGLEKATIRQKFSNHTVTFLDYRITDKKKYLMPPENTPVSVRWGQGLTGVSTFYGYVNHRETVVGDNGRALSRLVVLGTSKRMNATATSSWQGTTRSHIAREIAARHRMRSVVHDHPYVVEDWATGVRSDWSSLKALADEAGYRLWVDGATLWMIDPSRWRHTANAMSTPVIRERDIEALQIYGGTNIPGEMTPSSRQVQFGLDYRTNEFFEATSGDPLQPAEVLGATVNTFSEAQTVADAVERKQQDEFVLKATIFGSSRVHPGHLTMFESGRVNTDQAGLWLVSEATHEITQSDFVSKIVATRGSQATPLVRATDTLRGTPGQDQAVVRDGLTWEAALQEHIHA